jgi:hypothetical protein
VFSFRQVSTDVLRLAVAADEYDVQRLVIARQIRNRPLAGGLAVTGLTLDESVDAQGSNTRSVDKKVFQPRWLLYLRDGEGWFLGLRKHGRTW